MLCFNQKYIILYMDITATTLTDCSHYSAAALISESTQQQTNPGGTTFQYHGCGLPDWTNRVKLFN